MCALLAIGVQVLIAAHGGRLCYAAPIAPSDGCANRCCHLDEPAVPVARLDVTLASMTPLGPVESDCCIEQHQGDFAAQCGAADARPEAGGAALAAVPARSGSDPPASPVIRHRAARDGQPPPSMRVIRTTVLLI